jgi:hypothetical protein
MSDRASKALAEASLPGEPLTYDARSKRSGVPLTTLYYRDHGRRSKEEKAQGQQYLTPSDLISPKNIVPSRPFLALTLGLVFIQQPPVPFDRQDN